MYVLLVQRLPGRCPTGLLQRPRRVQARAAQIGQDARGGRVVSTPFTIQISRYKVSEPRGVFVIVTQDGAFCVYFETGTAQAAFDLVAEKYPGTVCEVDV